MFVLLGHGPSATDDVTSEPTDTTPAAVAVEATSSYAFTTVDQMIDNSDLIVRGRVVATERGPLVGEADASVVARVVTLQVEDVLGGRLAASTTTDRGTILVEEEGWLPDGSPLIVNGVAPSQVGDDGIWFLQVSPDPDLPSFLVINSQGRYLVDGNGLRGGDQRDALVQELQRLSPDALEQHGQSLIDWPAQAVVRWGTTSCSSWSRLARTTASRWFDSASAYWSCSAVGAGGPMRSVRDVRSAPR